MGKTIYVIAPYGVVTGGTDATHQLCFYLNKCGFNAKLIYCDKKTISDDIPQAFKRYISEYGLLDSIDDQPFNSIIVPETYSFLLKKYTNMKKCIWWLSVDNNLNQRKKDKLKIIFRKIMNKNFWKKLFSGFYNFKKISDFRENKPYNFKEEDSKIIHLCASYYAFNYVKSLSKNRVELLLDPVSDFFLTNKPYFVPSGRNNTVLYNPKKNYEFTKKIMEAAPEINYLPLQGYSYDQLLDLYRSNKLYIDFGNFPGSDRIPREAAFNGMLILTGKNGASGVYDDLPISDEFKIDSNDKNIDLIVKRINFILQNYENLYHKFDFYRKTLVDLEPKFIESIKSVFGEEN